MLGRLRNFTHSLRQWSLGEAGGTAADAAAVLVVADRALKDARESQGEARELLGAVLTLLQAAGRSGRASRLAAR